MTHWMEGAVRRPGALRRRARAAHLSVLEFARRHAHDPGLRGRQARFALIAQHRPIPPLPSAAGRNRRGR
jgi:hypothetical protein